MRNHVSPKRAAVRSAAVSFLTLFLGCGAFPIPDQSGYAAFTTLALNEDAVVRLYLAPIPGLETIAVHPWFVTKAAGASTFDRWEVHNFTREDLSYTRRGDSWGHVWKNAVSNPEGWSTGGQYILAELRGPQAETVIAFIEAQSPLYPCRGTYVVFPGPNSNTYAQWVLDETGWDVTLPPTAIGKDAPVSCG